MFIGLLICSKLLHTCERAAGVDVARADKHIDRGKEKRRAFTYEGIPKASILRGNASGMRSAISK